MIKMNIKNHDFGSKGIAFEEKYQENEFAKTSQMLCKRLFYPYFCYPRYKHSIGL